MTTEGPAVQTLKHNVRRISILMEKIADLHDDTVVHVEKIIRSLPPDDSPPDEGPCLQGTHPSSDLEVWESPSGKLTFSFNLQKPFYLPRRLGKTLLFLATAPPKRHPLDLALSATGAGSRSRLICKNPHGPELSSACATSTM